MKRRDFLGICTIPALGITTWVKRKEPDTLESLAAEFGYELSGNPYEGTGPHKTQQFITQFMKYHGKFAFAIKIEHSGVIMPLREQFVFADARHKAFQAARTDL